jgi:hypothetical protein
VHCYLAYKLSARTLYLVNDEGTGLLPGISVDGSGTVANSQCLISVSNRTASPDYPNVLFLNIAVTFTSAFTGNKVVYTAARDLEGGNSGWVPMDAVLIPGPSVSPSVSGWFPNTGSISAGSMPLAATAKFGDTDGYTFLGVVNILINDALDGRHACYLAYSRPLNTLYLVNDNGDGLLPGISGYATGTISNSQCTVTLQQPVVQTFGTELDLILRLSFSDFFAGHRIVYMAARDLSDLHNSGWQPAGAVTIFW